MIKIVVSNMSCGHCQLKIKADLESNGYIVHNINMDEHTVLIDATEKEISHIVNILDNINYVVDRDQPILNIEEKTLWHDKLDDEKNYEQLLNYLSEIDVEITGFSEENFGIVMLCNSIEYQEIIQYIEDTL